MWWRHKFNEDRLAEPTSPRQVLFQSLVKNNSVESGERNTITEKIRCAAYDIIFYTFTTVHVAYRRILRFNFQWGSLILGHEQSAPQGANTLSHSHTVSLQTNLANLVSKHPIVKVYLVILCDINLSKFSPQSFADRSHKKTVFPVYRIKIANPNDAHTLQKT